MTEPTKIKITIPGETRSHLLVEQSAVDWFMLADNAEVQESDVEAHMGPRADTGDAFWDDDDYRRFRPYNVVRGADGTGVLVIAVRGSLMPDFPYQAGVYATGYEYISSAVRRGAADATVRSILLDVNSPGGAVRGCAECGLAIAEAAKAKPVIAHTDGMAASAAYWLASQATQIHVGPTAEVGSIGVITGHADYSEMLKMSGVKYTPLFAGERKADLNPYVPLTDEAKSAMMKRLNAIYAEFISTVARGRKIDGNDIRATQAGVFAAREAVRIGLADAVSTRAQALSAAFGAKATAPTTNDNGNEDQAAMTDTTKTTAAAPAPETQAAAPAPDANAVQAAVSAAMERAKDILGCDEAKGREAQAHMFAFDAAFAGLPADKVKALLAAAPVAAAAPAPAPASAATQNPFAAAMSGTPNPEVGAGVSGDGQDDGVLAAVLAGLNHQ